MINTTLDVYELQSAHKAKVKKGFGELVWFSLSDYKDRPRGLRSMAHFRPTVDEYEYNVFPYLPL